MLITQKLRVVTSSHTSERISEGNPTKRCMASVRNFRIFSHTGLLPWHPFSLLDSSFCVDLCSFLIKEPSREWLCSLGFAPWPLGSLNYKPTGKSVKPFPEVSTKARMLRMQERDSYWCECLHLSTYLLRDYLFRILLEFYLLGRNLQSGFSLARALKLMCLFKRIKRRTPIGTVVQPTEQPERNQWLGERLTVSM